MIVGRAPVKHSHGDSTNRPTAGRASAGLHAAVHRRARVGWLDGWALILPSVGLALLAAITAVPRATEPRWVPEPVSRPHRLAAELDGAINLARQAQSQPLPLAVREAGEMYRRLGRAQHELARALVGQQVQSWRDMLRTVEADVGTGPVLQLRALQCSLLVNAIRRWQLTGDIDDELIELGGDLVDLVKASRESLTEAEEWALALKRWTSLAGRTNSSVFRPPREIELTQLHFFYAHPSDVDDAFDTRVRILNRYAQLDPDYPVDYALGVLMTQSGRFGAAASFFDKQLELHPDGAFALRARNHLIWVAQRLSMAGDNGSQ